jgi:hypothetical protein
MSARQELCVNYEERVTPILGTKYGFLQMSHRVGQMHPRTLFST